MSQKFISTFIGASLLLTFTGLLSKGLGFVREILYAANFGMSREFDVFLVSIALPMVINAAFIYLCQNFFIPAFNMEKVSNPQNQKQFFSQYFYFFIILGLITYVILLVFANPIIDAYLAGADSSSKILAKNLFKIFIITIPLNAVFAIISALLQAKYEFIPTAVANLLVNIVIILCMILFSKLLNIYVIPMAFVIGYVIQFLYVIWIIRNEIIWYFDFKQLKILIRAINLPVILTLTTEVLSISFVLVDRYFLDKVDEGGIGSLNYAYNLFFLPISILSMALSTAILPKISQTFVTKNLNQLGILFFEVLKINSVIFCMISLIFITEGEWMVKLAYQRGEFTLYNALVTNRVLIIYSIGFIFYSSYSVINKMFYGTNLISELLFLTIATFLFKTILNCILVNQYKQYGLAISTLLTFIILASIGLIILSRKLKLQRSLAVVKNILFYPLLAVLIYVLFKILVIVFPLNNLLNFINYGIVLCVLYVSVLIILGNDEIKLITNIFRKIFKLPATIRF